MSAFLDKVSEEAEKSALRAWVRGSVGEMDRILDDGFPKVFGKNWRQKMSDFPTASRTKLLTYVFDHALEETAERQGVNYRAANNEGPSETNNFDCYILDYKVENKLSLGKTASSFATGSSHNTDKKVPRILAVKIRSVDYKTKAVFAAFVDLSDARSDDSKWRAGDSRRTGFSTLQIAVSDKNIIVPICGELRKIRANSKYINTDYEPFRPERR